MSLKQDIVRMFAAYRDIPLSSVKFEYEFTSGYHPFEHRAVVINLCHSYDFIAGDSSTQEKALLDLQRKLRVVLAKQKRRISKVLTETV